MSTFLTESGRRRIVGPFTALPKPIASVESPLLDRLKREIAAKAAPVAKPVRLYTLPKGLRREEAKKQPADSTWEKCQMYGAVLASVTGKFLLRRPATPGKPGKSILEAPGGLEMASQTGWTWPRTGVGGAQEHSVDAVMRAVACETGYKAHVMGTISGTYGSCCYYLMRPKGWDWTRMTPGATQELRWALYDEACDLLEGNDLVILEQAHSRLVAGIEAYSPDQPRDAHGRWTREGEAFLSPHGEEPLTFDQAVTEAGSDRQKQFEADGIALGKKIGLDVKPESAVGDTREWGTENAVLAHLGAVKDFDTVRYWTAKMGSQANQLAVIPFISDSKGPDRIYRFELGGDAKTVRGILDKEGIDYRTLVVGKDSSKVTVFDPGKQLTDQMHRIEANYGAKIKVTKGRGEFLPPDATDRSSSQKAYAAVIDGYERGQLRGRDGGRNRLRNPGRSDSAKIAAAKDDDGHWVTICDKGGGGSSKGSDSGGGGDCHPVLIDGPRPEAKQRGANKSLLTLTPPTGTVPVNHKGGTGELATPQNRNLGRRPDFTIAPLGAYQYDEGHKVDNAHEDYAKVVEQRGGFTRRLTDDVPHGATSLQEQGLAQRAADAARKAAGLAPQIGEGLSTYKQRVADAQPYVEPTHSSTFEPSESTHSSTFDRDNATYSDNGRTPVYVAPKEVPPVDLEKASPDEKKLLTGRITSSTDAPGRHINTVKFVEFADGSKAVFKPDPHPGEGDNSPSQFGSYSGDWVRNNVTPGYATEREVGAYQVAKLVGMDDMVAPVVIRKLDGERGALLKYVPGEDAGAVDNPWDGMKDMLRAAAFDYVIGNEDRHQKNWVVENPDASNAKIHLIDHGYSFPDHGDFDPDMGQQRFTHHAAQLRESGSVTPQDLAGPFVKNRDAIMRALSNLGLPKEALEGVDARIDRLKSARDWGRLV